MLWIAFFGFGTNSTNATTIIRLPNHSKIFISDSR